MVKIGLPVARADVDAPVAEHFGRAEWLLVMESPDRCTFVRNTGLDGRSAVAELAARGCTDVVARRMGQGAFAHVTAAGMKAWEADAGVTGRTAVKRLAAGELRRLVPAPDGHRPGHGHAHGGR